MNKAVLAKVHWVTPEQGGRMALPTGKQYATVSRFHEDAETWLQEAWSMVDVCVALHDACDRAAVTG